MDPEEVKDWLLTARGFRVLAEPSVQVHGLLKLGFVGLGSTLSFFSFFFFLFSFFFFLFSFFFFFFLLGNEQDMLLFFFL